MSLIIITQFLQYAGPTKAPLLHHIVNDVNRVQNFYLDQLVSGLNYVAPGIAERFGMSSKKAVNKQSSAYYQPYPTNQIYQLVEQKQHIRPSPQIEVITNDLGEPEWKIIKANEKLEDALDALETKKVMDLEEDEDEEIENEED